MTKKIDKDKDKDILRTPPQSNRIDVCASSISSIYGKFCNIIISCFFTGRHVRIVICTMQALWPVKDGSFDFSPLSSEGRPPARQTTSSEGSSADHHRPSLWLNTTTLTSAMHYCTKYTRIPEHHQSHCIAPHLTFGAPRLVAPRFCEQTCTRLPNHQPYLDLQ